MLHQIVTHFASLVCARTRVFRVSSSLAFCYISCPVIQRNCVINVTDNSTITHLVIRFLNFLDSLIASLRSLIAVSSVNMTRFLSQVQINSHSAPSPSVLRFTIFNLSHNNVTPSLIVSVLLLGDQLKHILLKTENQSVFLAILTNFE